MKGRSNCVRGFGHEHDFCQAKKAENIDPRTNYAVKYATARGHLSFKAKKEHHPNGNKHILNSRGHFDDYVPLGPLGLHPLIPQEFSRVTEVQFSRFVWCKKLV